MVKRARHVNGWSGRDVNQEHRVSTPLELFFDLTFAVSLAAVAEEMSHRLAEGEVFAALLSFGISMLAIAMNPSASCRSAISYPFRTICSFFVIVRSSF